MKAKRENEILVKVGYRLPPDLIKRIEESAIANRRSINDEVIILLESALASAGGLTAYLDARFNRLESRLPTEPK